MALRQPFIAFSLFTKGVLVSLQGSRVRVDHRFPLGSIYQHNVPGVYRFKQFGNSTHAGDAEFAGQKSRMSRTAGELREHSDGG